MSKLSSLQKRQAQIHDTISKLSEERIMTPGAFKTVFVKCGNPNCWCANDDDGHPFNRITWTENGKARTKSIPEEDIPWIKEVTQNYRDFRKIKRELKSIQIKLKVDVDKWEARLISKTRKLRACLKNL